VSRSTFAFSNFRSIESPKTRPLRDESKCVGPLLGVVAPASPRAPARERPGRCTARSDRGPTWRGSARRNGARGSPGSRCSYCGAYCGSQQATSEILNDFSTPGRTRTCDPRLSLEGLERWVQESARECTTPNFGAKRAVQSAPECTIGAYSLVRSKRVGVPAVRIEQAICASPAAASSGL